MSTVYVLLAVFSGLIGVVAFFFILIQAFKDEVWKGLLALFCGFYMLYYALVEYDHEHKWLIVLAWLLGTAMAGVFLEMGGYRDIMPVRS